MSFVARWACCSRKAASNLREPGQWRGTVVVDEEAGMVRDTAERIAEGGNVISSVGQCAVHAGASLPIGTSATRRTRRAADCMADAIAAMPSKGRVSLSVRIASTCAESNSANKGCRLIQGAMVRLCATGGRWQEPDLHRRVVGGHAPRGDRNKAAGMATIREQPVDGGVGVDVVNPGELVELPIA